MTALVGNAEAISRQIPADVAFEYAIILMIIGLMMLFLLIFTLHHDIRNKPDI